MVRIKQCHHCQQHYHIDAVKFAYGVSSWACPFCKQVSDFAEAQAAQPGMSQGAQTFWHAVSGLAIIAGLFVAAHIADRAIEQLTA